MPSSKPSSVSTSKETRAAQREGITNYGTTMSESASSMRQLPVHLVTNSPTSPDTLPPRAFRERSSNISLPVVPPGREETRKRNESPHPQEDSRGQITVIRPHAEQVDRTAAIQSSVEPPAGPATYPLPSSSSERRTNRPHAEQVNRVASIQPPTKPIPSSPLGERNVTRPHAEPVNRTASSFLQPSIKPSTPYPPTSSSSERNVVRPRAELVSRTASAHPPAKHSTPSPPLDRPTTSILPSPSPAPALTKMAYNRMQPYVDRRNARPDELSRMDPSAASRRPPSTPPEHTVTTTEHHRQDHKDPSAVPQRLPVPRDHIPITTDDPRQDRKVPSVTSDRPSVPPKHTPATTVSPFLQDPKDTSAAPPRQPALLKYTPESMSATEVVAYSFTNFPMRLRYT